MRKRIAAAITVLCALFVMTACTGIPYGGGVNKGAVATGVPDTDIQFLPAGPRQEATPEEILRGFVDAATSPAGNWAIAREFLTAEFSRQWEPSRAVYIDEGARLVSAAGTNALRLNTSVTATVDARGVYANTGRLQAPDLKFTFVKVAGAWRIASGPAGVVLDRATFPKVYSQSTLFFYNAGLTSLIPDVRWFPARSSISTRIVKALLGGPSDWLSTSGAAVSAIPVGAALEADSVPVDGGVASVNFNSQTVKATEGLSIRILRQLTASMVGVPDVQSVSLQYSGSPQGQAQVPLRAALISPTGYDTAVVIRDGAFGVLDDKGMTALPGLSAGVLSLAPSAVSVSGDRSVAVVNSASGVYTVRAARKPALVDARGRLIPAAIDEQSFVWTVPADKPTEIRITGRAGTSRGLRAPWSSATKISFLSVEPDGTRLIAGFSTPSGQRVCAASIGHGDDLWPKTIGECLYLTAPEGNMISAAWIDGIRVGILTSTKTTKLRLSTIGGLFQDSTAPVGATMIAGAGARLTPRLLTNYGELYLLQSLNRWSVIGDKVALLGTGQ